MRKEVKRLIQTAKQIQQLFEANGWDYCVIGGLAVQHWARPRLTMDVDFTLLTGFGSEETYIDVLLDAYRSRVDNGRAFALMHRILLLVNESGVEIDIALGALPFEQRSVQAAQTVDYGEATLRICSAEYLAVMKAFAGRPQDWLDVEALMRRNSGALDWDLIEKESSGLAELRDGDWYSRLMRFRSM